MRRSRIILTTIPIGVMFAAVYPLFRDIMSSDVFVQFAIHTHVFDKFKEYGYDEQSVSFFIKTTLLLCALIISIPFVYITYLTSDIIVRPFTCSYFFAEMLPYVNNIYDEFEQRMSSFMEDRQKQQNPSNRLIIYSSFLRDLHKIRSLVDTVCEGASVGVTVFIFKKHVGTDGAESVRLVEEAFVGPYGEDKITFAPKCFKWGEGVSGYACARGEVTGATRSYAYIFTDRRFKQFRLANEERSRSVLVIPIMHLSKKVPMGAITFESNVYTTFYPSITKDSAFRDVSPKFARIIGSYLLMRYRAEFNEIRPLLQKMPPLRRKLIRYKIKLPAFMRRRPDFD